MYTHMVIPSSRSSVKVMVRYQGHVFHKNGHCRAFVYHKHTLFHHVFYPLKRLVQLFNGDLSICKCYLGWKVSLRLLIQLYLLSTVQNKIGQFVVSDCVIAPWSIFGNIMTEKQLLSLVLLPVEKCLSIFDWYSAAGSWIISEYKH